MSYPTLFGSYPRCNTELCLPKYTLLVDPTRRTVWVPGCEGQEAETLTPYRSPCMAWSCDPLTSLVLFGSWSSPYSRGEFRSTLVGNFLSAELFMTITGLGVDSPMRQSTRFTRGGFFYGATLTWSSSWLQTHAPPAPATCVTSGRLSR